MKNQAQTESPVTINRMKSFMGKKSTHLFIKVKGERLKVRSEGNCNYKL